MQDSKNTMETVQEVEPRQEDLAQLTDEELEVLQGAGVKLDNIKLMAKLTVGGVMSTIGRIYRTVRR